jgi:hypothetical protein
MSECALYFPRMKKKIPGLPFFAVSQFHGDSSDLHSKPEHLLSRTNTAPYYAVSLIYTIDHDQAQTTCNTNSNTKT